MCPLTMKECHHLMGIWRICYKCEKAISLEEKAYIVLCQCLRHVDDCPQVRDTHPCSLELKQELVTNYVKRTFLTDDVRGAYGMFMDRYYPNLMEENSLSLLTRAESNVLMMAWRLCYRCERSIEANTVSTINTCGCLNHNGCGVPQVRKNHDAATCSLQLKRKIINRFVRKTWSTDNAIKDYRMFLKTQAPLLVQAIRSQQDRYRGTVRVVDLEDDSTNHRHELNVTRQVCEELKQKNLELETENKRLKEENQSEKDRNQQVEKEKEESVRQLNRVKEELKRTTKKFTKLHNNINEMKNKWFETRGEQCTEFEEKRVDETDCDTSDECIFNSEWDSFKQHFKELEEKITELGQKSFATRNSQLIGEISRKIVSTVEISSRVKEDVVKALSTGGSELEKALDELMPIEAQFPTSSSNKKNGRHPDMELLD